MVGVDRALAVHPHDTTVSDGDDDGLPVLAPVLGGLMAAGLSVARPQGDGAAGWPGSPDALGAGGRSNTPGSSRRYGTFTTTVCGRPRRARRRRVADWL